MMGQSLPWVCIPGFMLDETLWNDMVTYLPKQQPICHSSLTDGDTISSIADNIVKHTPERFILLGFSLGGYVARSIAARYPKRVAGLVLIATSLRDDTPAQRKAKIDTLEIQRHLRFRGIGRVAIVKTLRPDNNNNETLINRIRAMSERLGFGELEKQSILDRSTPVGQEISCPTLIVAGEQDQMRSMEEFQELQHFIPQAQSIVIANSGHMIPLEQPEKLAQTIQKWVQKNLLSHTYDY